MSEQPFRLAADIGGTFTDVVLESPTDSWSAKVLTTHAAPEEAILDGVRQVLERAGATFDQLAMVIHGTTLATNALIERRGAHTALITTKGFRDVLEMRTENRFEQYDLNLVLPAALIARRDRHVVDERIAANGEVLQPLARDEIERVVEAIVAGDYQSVAVGLIHIGD